MRYLIIFFGVFLFADVSYIINLIKKMENYQPEFKPFVDYNIFAFEFKTPKIENRVVVDNRFVIYAIFQNKVNIDGRWYKVGDEIDGYKIIKITTSSVVLKKGNKIKVLSFNPKILKVER